MTTDQPTPPTESAPAPSSAVELAIRDIVRLEEALKRVLPLARIAHHSAMRASEEIGEKHHTGACHACVALMGIAARSLNEGNDAARFARHAITYPQNSNMVRLTEVLMEFAVGNISSGKAREILREENYPAEVWQKVTVAGL